MAVEATVYSILSTNVPLLAISAGLAARIKPPGDWQSLTRPYIIHKPVTFDPTHIHSETSGALIDHYPNYQISVVADSYASARAVSNAVKTAIRGSTNGLHSGTKFFLRGEFPLEFDTDRKIFEIALDFEVWGEPDLSVVSG